MNTSATRSTIKDPPCNSNQNRRVGFTVAAGSKKADRYTSVSSFNLYPYKQKSPDFSVETALLLSTIMKRWFPPFGFHSHSFMQVSSAISFRLPPASISAAASFRLAPALRFRFLGFPFLSGPISRVFLPGSRTRLPVRFLSPFPDSLPTAVPQVLPFRISPQGSTPDFRILSSASVLASH